MVTYANPWSAQAMPVFDTGSGPSVPPQVAVATSGGGGFDWGDAGIGAGVALGVALGGIGAVRLTRGRGRLAGQH